MYAAILAKLKWPSDRVQSIIIAVWGFLWMYQFLSDSAGGNCCGSRALRQWQKSGA